MQYIFLSQLQALDIKRCISDVCKPIDIKVYIYFYIENIIRFYIFYNVDSYFLFRPHIQIVIFLSIQLSENMKVN